MVPPLHGITCTFVIAQNGSITYAGGDYRKRVEPQEVLEALKAFVRR